VTGGEREEDLVYETAGCVIEYSLCPEKVHFVTHVP